MSEKNYTSLGRKIAIGICFVFALALIPVLFYIVQTNHINPLVNL